MFSPNSASSLPASPPTQANRDDGNSSNVDNMEIDVQIYERPSGIALLAQLPQDVLTKIIEFCAGTGTPIEIAQRIQGRVKALTLSCRAGKNLVNDLRGLSRAIQLALAESRGTRLQIWHKYSQPKAMTADLWNRHVMGQLLDSPAVDLRETGAEVMCLILDQTFTQFSFQTLLVSEQCINPAFQYPSPWGMKDQHWTKLLGFMSRHAGHDHRPFIEVSLQNIRYNARAGRDNALPILAKSIQSYQRGAIDLALEATSSAVARSLEETAGTGTLRSLNFLLPPLNATQEFMQMFYAGFMACTSLESLVIDVPCTAQFPWLLKCAERNSNLHTLRLICRTGDIENLNALPQLLAPFKNLSKLKVFHADVPVEPLLATVRKQYPSLSVEQGN